MNGAANGRTRCDHRKCVASDRSFGREQSGIPWILVADSIKQWQPLLLHNLATQFDFLSLTMKRCSQCHFTFEDHQQVCYFDGTELTPYPAPLPSSQDSSVPMSPFCRLARSRVCWAALSVVGGLISNALLMIYYDSASQPNVTSKAESRNAMVSLVSPAQLPIQPPTHIARPDTLTSKPKITAAAKPSSPTARRTTTFKPQASRSPMLGVRSSTPVRKQPLAFETAQPKKESNVTAIFKKSGSILKKTVSILKKPFDR